MHLIVVRPVSSYLTYILVATVLVCFSNLLRLGPLAHTTYGLRPSHVDLPTDAIDNMTKQDEDRESHLKDFRRDLYKVEGGERLKLWMEYTRYQDQDADHHVG